MNQRILVTGACGLVGSALVPLLHERGATVCSLDLAGSGDAFGDVRDAARVHQALDGCDGIVHLAAVSRVIWGEQQPELCRATNIGGLRNVLQAAAASRKRPWVIFASSREVYGQPATLPVDEDCPLQPMNVYGHTKVEGETMIESARRDGLRACTIRLSNVFGSVSDHADRVVPAFARGAAHGEELRIDGAGHTFDFTYIDDVAEGIALLVTLLSDKAVAAPPPIHFVNGVPTTLLELAEMAIEIAGGASTIRHAPPRNFDVAQFYGSPLRAKQVLGWAPRTDVRTGLTRLVHAFRTQQASREPQTQGSARGLRP